MPTDRGQIDAESGYLRSNPNGVRGLGALTADVERLRHRLGPPTDDLTAGLETNIEEIHSAVMAIPPSAIAVEIEWMRFARALAHEAQITRNQAGEIWEILEAASRLAPNYDEAKNRRRWLRYIDEALDRDNPITIATVFDLAKKHGWPGWSPPTVTSTGNQDAAMSMEPDPLDFVMTTVGRRGAADQQRVLFPARHIRDLSAKRRLLAKSRCSPRNN